MNNLHRELAPVSAAAWAEIEEEARRTFKRHLAGRRVVDVAGPGGLELAAVGTGHLRDVEPPASGVISRQREAISLVELRVPFFVSREAVDDVDRGAKDSDWQPLKDTARQMAFAEDRAIVEGYAAAGIPGLRASSSNPHLPLPADPRDYPNIVSQAISALRLAGVNGPYSVLLGRGLHGCQRDVRPRLSHPRTPGAAGRRRHHLGPGHRRRRSRQYSRRRLRIAHRAGSVDRLPDPRRVDRPVVFPGVHHLSQLHQRGRRRAALTGRHGPPGGPRTTLIRHCPAGTRNAVRPCSGRLR
jgi:hypothetical protein